MASRRMELSSSTSRMCCGGLISHRVFALADASAGTFRLTSITANISGETLFAMVEFTVGYSPHKSVPGYRTGQGRAADQAFCILTTRASPQKTPPNIKAVHPPSGIPLGATLSICSRGCGVDKPYILLRRLNCHEPVLPDAPTVVARADRDKEKEVGLAKLCRLPGFGE